MINNQIIEFATNIFKLKKSVLIQKYISSIETKGERSLIVIDGKCLYAYTKHPAKNNFLVHNHWGGHSEESVVTEDDKAIAKKIYGLLNDPPLYMRTYLLYEKNLKSSL